MPNLRFSEEMVSVWAVELRFDLSRDDRLAFRGAHREKLAAALEAGTLVMSGPFEDGEGALLLFSLPTRDAVEAFMAQDPYYSAPGVDVVWVREWAPLFGGDERPG